VPRLGLIPGDRRRQLRVDPHPAFGSPVRMVGVVAVETTTSPAASSACRRAWWARADLEDPRTMRRQPGGVAGQPLPGG
jgi:hypothetical protein